MSPSQEEARAALRARQGAGARYDAGTAPAEELDLARRGTAYFARILTNLSDEGLLGASSVQGKNRRWLVAAISLQARMLAQAISFVRSNACRPLPFDFSIGSSEIAFAATLPSQALRNLFAHSEVHLNVEWRDLSGEGWTNWFEDHRGRRLFVRETPFIRASRLWRCAVDLNAGGRQIDIPAQLKSVSLAVADPLPPI
ncbi:maleylpyruvate isomerase N-terminal domain-containing protein [Mesorhizobium sp. YR577]|uniref:maleylpyruvate isomerase N-terminal domain-containing protein n=1 Tax=Mesorhizobium sp. YR577 TaxID=1884373 RepID=UPI0008E12DDD|nr:maleylpyruvate isomerase N-terminal domain-containing protein [Mesorhizobium sp. YR577]SFU21936.1 maleylpyruvate isomerase [Mesorhizobium sp. YR577]